MNKNVSLFTGSLLFCTLNPLVTNRLSDPYHLDEYIFILGSSGVFFLFLFHFSMKTRKANKIAPDGRAASHLGLFCLPKSHKKGARLKRVKVCNVWT